MSPFPANQVTTIPPVTQYHWYLFEDNFEDPPPAYSTTENMQYSVTPEVYTTQVESRRPHTSHIIKATLINTTIPPAPPQHYSSHNNYGYNYGSQHVNQHPKSYDYIQLFDHKGHGGWGSGEEYFPGTSLVQETLENLGLLLLPLPFFLLMVPLIMAPAVPLAFLAHHLAQGLPDPFVTSTTPVPSNSPTSITQNPNNPPVPTEMSSILQTSTSFIMNGNLVPTGLPPFLPRPQILNPLNPFPSNPARLVKAETTTSPPVLTATFNESDFVNDSSLPFLSFPFQSLTNFIPDPIPKFPFLFLNNTYDDMQFRKKNVE